MYNQLYNYQVDNNFFSYKGFKEGHSIDHALIALINSIYGSFNQNKYTLGVSIDSSNAFYTIDHKFLLKKQVYTA